MRNVLHGMVLACGLTTALSALADRQVLIGYAGPMTGASAHLGKDAQNGVRLAIDEANAKNIVIGGQKVRFAMVSEDDAGDPRQAVTVAQRLVDSNIVGVVGHINSGATIPASKVYADAGIPQISPSSTAPEFTRLGRATAFRVIGDDRYVGSVIAQYLVETIKAKRIALIDDRTAYGQGAADAVEAALVKQGVKVVAREYTTDRAVDFRSLLTRIKSKSPDAIFYGGVDAQAGPLRKQMVELSVSGVLVGEAIETNKFVELAGPAAAAGTVSAESGQPVGTMPQGEAFEAAFSKRFGPVVIYAPYAYDAAWTLIRAMMAANSTAPTQYITALKKLSIEGVTGPIAFDSNGDLRAANVTLYRVDAGKFKALRTISLK